MSKLVWDKTGERYFETGVKNGVLYVKKDGAYGAGVAWNGLTAVTESPSGAEATAFYADDIKYLNLVSAEEFGGTIEAYMSPEEFDVCDGTASLVKGVNIGQQKRAMFGLCYRTCVGNDEDSDKGYKLHIVYGATASPSERAYATINDSPEAMTLSWEFTTTPEAVVDENSANLGFKPTSLITIDSTKADATKLAALEAILYGSESEEARLPLPYEVATTMGYTKVAG